VGLGHGGQVASISNKTSFDHSALLVFVLSGLRLRNQEDKSQCLVLVARAPSVAGTHIRLSGAACNWDLSWSDMVNSQKDNVL